MPDVEGLSENELGEIEKIRASAADLVAQITDLQRGWNHGAKATRVLDEALASLTELDSKLSEP